METQLNGHNTLLLSARGAHLRRDWLTSYECFARASHAALLATDDLDTPAMTSLCLVVEALAAIGEARMPDAFGLIDEAMLTVLAGEIPIEWTGDIYCLVLHHCNRVADLPRMRAWTQSMERRCENFAAQDNALGDNDLAAADAATAQSINSQLGLEAPRISAQPAQGGLTKREIEILTRIASGATNMQVADQTFISEKNVGRHLANVYTKLGVSSRTAAVTWAYANNVLRSTD